MYDVNVDQKDPKHDMQNLLNNQELNLPRRKIIINFLKEIKKDVLRRHYQSQ